MGGGIALEDGLSGRPEPGLERPGSRSGFPSGIAEEPVDGEVEPLVVMPHSAVVVVGVELEERPLDPGVEDNGILCADERIVVSVDDEHGALDGAIEVSYVEGDVTQPLLQ